VSVVLRNKLFCGMNVGRGTMHCEFCFLLCLHEVVALFLVRKYLSCLVPINIKQMTTSTTIL
jgi:hypothetical protein